jgi:hypothetical protein
MSRLETPSYTIGLAKSKMFSPDAGMNFSKLCTLAEPLATKPFSVLPDVSETATESAISSGVANCMRSAIARIVQLCLTPPVASSSEARSSICTRPNMYCEPNGDVEDCAPPL